MKTWMCVVCGFICDEAQGRPEGGIPPGTPWEKVRTDWKCPECNEGMDRFEWVEI